MWGTAESTSCGICDYIPIWALSLDSPERQVPARPRLIAADQRLSQHFGNIIGQGPTSCIHSAPRLESKNNIDWLRGVIR